MKFLAVPLTIALSLSLVLSAMPETASAADDRVRVKRRARPGTKAPKDDASKAEAPARKFSKKSRYNKPTGRLHTEFRNATPEWLVKQAFHCALDFDESSGFNCYTKWVIEARKDNPRALKHLRTYQWAHFRKWAPTYLEPGKKFGLREASRRPAKVTGKTDMVKVFWVSRHRDNPAPIELKREAGVWRIFSNSL